MSSAGCTMHKLGSRFEEKSPRQRFRFVLRPKYRCSTRDRDAMDRSFLGAVGGAATEPRSGAGTAFLRRAPLGSNPGAGCCTARVPASGASTGQGGKKIGRVGECNRRAGRLEAPLFNLRGVRQALRSLLVMRRQKGSLIASGRIGRGTMKRVSPSG